MTPDQSDFGAALLDPEMTAPKNLIAPNGGPAGARFDIYRNNVTASLVDAMRTGFPVIELLLGAKNFQTLALMYIRQNPPRTPVLMFYGQGFDQFIAQFEPLKELPYLADVARLELARRNSYHAQNADIFGADQMGTLGEVAFMAGRLQFASATMILSSSYPIFDIWLRNSGAPDHPIGNQAQDVLLTRPEFDVQVYPLHKETSAFLNDLRDFTIAAAVERALTLNPNFPLADALGLILTSGLACGHISSEAP